jgi:apolipoprotein N-acyltransferase
MATGPRPRVLRLALAFTAGAATVFGFAPFHLALLPVATLAVLFWLWQRCAAPREAGWLGFAFGAGLFGAGVSWVFVALQNFGGVPGIVACVGTAGFVAYLALYPALAGWTIARFSRPDTAMRLVAAAAAWTLAEWLRGWVFTGFGWLALGYSALLPEHALPLSGLAPVGGVYLVTFALAACAAVVVQVIDGLARGTLRSVAAGALTVVLIFTIASPLRQVEWTRPEGAPVSVSLVQGNVPQQQKFDPEYRARTFAMYQELAAAAKGRLVVLPESAFAMFLQQVPPPVLANLAATGRERNGDVLVGLFTIDPPPDPDAEPLIYNSVLSLGTTPPQLYRKHHLVPFGETIPLLSVFGWFINQVLHIPLADQASGPAVQQPFDVAGQRVALNICYEDVFGAELARVAPGATLFVNVTNDAWYGRSVAALQHNQIAQMRALELGRPMLRATNTGVTAAIAHDGRVLARLPWFEQAILEIEISGRTGETPYVRWGDAFVAALAGLVLGIALLHRVVLGKRGDIP